MTVENPHNGKPRLVIQRLELENFKSYAGVQHIGPFHKSFSAIVGPNGSGKSNVIDAMLFVFGKRAKQLRLNKVSELIHKSTDYQHLEEARVSVYFEEIIDTGEESFDVVPDTQLVVSRTALKSNASNYYLNNKKSNFTEVTTMLKAKGVDLNNNRFLILQGEVEQISLMKPKAEDKNDTGLLEYLEDIIGTDQYKEKIEETAKQLEGLNEERQSSLQRAKLAERDRDGLQDAKELAEEYRRREVEEINNRTKICVHNMIQCEANTTKIETQLLELKTKLEYEQSKLGRYDDTMKTAEAAWKSRDKEKNKGSKKLDSMTERLKAIACESVSLTEKAKHLQTKAKNAGDAATKNKKKLKEQQEQAATAREELPELEARSKELHVDLEAATTSLQALQDSIKDEVNEIHKRLSKARSELAPWKDQMQAIEAAMQLGETELALIQDRSGQAARRLAEVREGLSEAEANVATKQAAVASMRDEIEQQRASTAQLQEAARSAAADVKRLEGEAGETRAAVFALRSAAENERSRGAVAKGLVDAQDRGELQGVYGRLGDLGAIDKKYDAAASNCCPALDNIVVDTTNTAQHCVEYLRRHNLGVATFLILDKQVHLQAEANKAVQPPEGAPRLFDLVKCHDAKLRPAFFYALRNTLVAEDIDQAMRISYRSNDRRWGRVVTLKGDLISENGTMSGGGGQVKTGKMCLGNAAPQTTSAKETRAELQKLEATLAQLEKQLQDARKVLTESTSAEKKAEKAVKELEMQVRKSALDVESDVKKSAELRAQVGQLETAATVTADDKQKIADLQQQVKAESARLARVQKDAEKLSQKVADTEAELENAGGAAMQEAKDLVATVKSDIASAEKQLARQRVLLDGAQKSEKKLVAEVTKKEKERAQAEEELLEVNEKKTAAEAESEQLSEKHAILEEELKELTSNLESAQAEFDSVKSDVGKIRAVEVQIKATIADQEDILTHETAKAAEWERKVDALTTQLLTMLPEGEQPPAVDREAIAAMSLQDRQQLEYRTTCLEAEMREMQKNVDMSAIEAFRAKDADLKRRLQELEEVTQRRNDVRSSHEDLRKRRLDEFMAAFMTISLKLKEMYQMITLGGDAELELVDSLDPFSEGIVFSVRPPKKSWKNIANLSGGEKTLSSLSLVFALHHFKPTPLYFMDEIDAALDFKNVSIVAHYVKERTKNAQFVVISLRNNMFELADHLVGIYKTNNCTKSVTINPNDFVVGSQTDVMQDRPLLQQQRVV